MWYNCRNAATLDHQSPPQWSGCSPIDRDSLISQKIDYRLILGIVATQVVSEISERRKPKTARHQEQPWWTVNTSSYSKGNITCYHSAHNYSPRSLSPTAPLPHDDSSPKLQRGADTPSGSTRLLKKINHEYNISLLLKTYLHPAQH